MINILHLSPWPIGGSTTFIVNLAKTFEAAGVPYRIGRLAARTEKKKREIGSFGVFYQNVSFEDAQKVRGVWLLASAPTNKEKAEQAVVLVHKSNGAFVFHDPNELGMYPHWELADRSRVVCIRETGLTTMPGGLFVPHPYVRVMGAAAGLPSPRKHAVSIARTSAVKNSHWILEANETLPAKLKVELFGEVNRFWWNFNVKPKHPEWAMPKAAGFPRLYGEAVRICAGFNYMVDMTIFKNDGGGTQYSLLEAMDAGTVPIMSSAWCAYPGIAKTLGFPVHNAAHLRDFLVELTKYPALRQQTEKFRQQNYNVLGSVHDPKRVAAAYTKHLGV